MAKRITELSSKSGDLSSSDVFMTDNGTITTKINYTALAAAIIEQYAGSTLAGSAQSVKAAIDGGKNNFVSIGVVTEIPSNADLDSYTTPGTYTAKSHNISATITNSPINRAFNLVVSRAIGAEASAWRNQFLFKSEDPATIYQRMTGGSTWTEWKKLPTREELDAKSNQALIQRANQDLDTLTASGSYYLTKMTNYPTGKDNAGFVRVYTKPDNSSVIKQIYIGYSDNEIFIRTYASSTWGAWEKLPTRAEFTALEARVAALEGN